MSVLKKKQVLQKSKIGGDENEVREHAATLIEFLRPWTVTAGKSLDSCKALLD